jgi:hypothetical protein
VCGAPSAWAQEKQKISYKVTAENAKYTQRNTIDVGDEPGHQLTLFEVHRTFPSNAPVINGVKLKETWARGYADYINSNGLSTNYTLYVLENGVGRAINVACRLQAAVKDKGRSPAYNALVSNRVYSEYFAQTKPHRVVKVTRNLRNMNDGAEFECRRLWLMRPYLSTDDPS